MNPDRTHVSRAKARRALAEAPRAPRRWDMPPKHAACGKRRCADLDQAIGYALHLTRQAGHPLRIYRCPRCAGWHVTKRPEWKDPTP